MTMFFYIDAVNSATDKDAISLFSKALKMHDEYPGTCYEICKLLTTFAKFNDKAKEAIFKSIEITYLFSLINKYSENVPLINQIFGIFEVLNEAIRKHFGIHISSVEPI